MLIDTCQCNFYFLFYFWWTRGMQINMEWFLDAYKQMLARTRRVKNIQEEFCVKIFGSHFGIIIIHRYVCQKQHYNVCHIGACWNIIVHYRYKVFSLSNLALLMLTYALYMYEKKITIIIITTPFFDLFIFL